MPFGYESLFGTGELTTATITLLIVISIWSLVWKGFALWKSANKRHLIWFVVILLVNTVGILEILYIFVFSKLGEKSRKKKKSKKK